MEIGLYPSTNFAHHFTARRFTHHRSALFAPAPRISNPDSFYLDTLRYNGKIGAGLLFVPTFPAHSLGDVDEK